MQLWLFCYPINFKRQVSSHKTSSLQYTHSQQPCKHSGTSSKWIEEQLNIRCKNLKPHFSQLKKNKPTNPKKLIFPLAATCSETLISPNPTHAAVTQQTTEAPKGLQQVGSWTIPAPYFIDYFPPPPALTPPSSSSLWQITFHEDACQETATTCLKRWNKQWAFAKVFPPLGAVHFSGHSVPDW